MTETDKARSYDFYNMISDYVKRRAEKYIVDRDYNYSYGDFAYDDFFRDVTDDAIKEMIENGELTAAVTKHIDSVIETRVIRDTIGWYLSRTYNMDNTRQDIEDNIINNKAFGKVLSPERIHDMWANGELSKELTDCLREYVKDPNAKEYPKHKKQETRDDR